MTVESSRITWVQRVVALAMVASAGLLFVAAVVFPLTSMGEQAAVTWGTQVGGAVWGVSLMAFPIVGWMIVRRHPQNLIGWLLLWVGFAAGLDFACAEYAATGVDRGWPLAMLAANEGNWGWILYIAVIGVFVTHLFPTGRPLSKRWGRWLAVLALALFAAALGSALEPGPLEIDPKLTNPYGVDSPIVELLSMGLMALPIGVLSGAVSVVVRYRRADAVERLQLRWFASAASLVAVGFVSVMISSLLFWPEATARPLWLGVFQDVVNVMWSAIPVAVGVAVFRYRLYAIDAVINRALVYGSLTAILLGLYAVAVLVFGVVLRPLAGESDLAIAVSTLSVAFIAFPLRRRIQAFIDRAFYRARYDAERLVETFSGRMRDQLDLDGIATELEATVRSAVHPSTAVLWLRPR